jgi:hypothetical protein
MAWRKPGPARTSSSPTTTPTRTSPRQGTATRRPKGALPSSPKGGR